MAVQNSDIIQIMPADGWEAYYEAGPTEDIVDVACFALHRNGAITAMIMDHTKGEIIYATRRRGFLKCIKLESQNYV